VARVLQLRWSHFALREELVFFLAQKGAAATFRRDSVFARAHFSGRKSLVASLEVIKDVSNPREGGQEDTLSLAKLEGR